MGSEKPQGYRNRRRAVRAGGRKGAYQSGIGSYCCSPDGQSDGNAAWFYRCRDTKEGDVPAGHKRFIKSQCWWDNHRGGEHNRCTFYKRECIWGRYGHRCNRNKAGRQTGDRFGYYCKPRHSGGWLYADQRAWHICGRWVRWAQGTGLWDRCAHNWTG